MKFAAELKYRLHVKGSFVKNDTPVLNQLPLSCFLMSNPANIEIPNIFIFIIFYCALKGISIKQVGLFVLKWLLSVFANELRVFAVNIFM